MPGKIVKKMELAEKYWEDIKAKVEVSGVIGYQVLKDYVTYFDFKNEKIGIR